MNAAPAVFAAKDMYSSSSSSSLNAIHHGQEFAAGSPESARPAGTVSDSIGWLLGALFFWLYTFSIAGDPAFHQFLRKPWIKNFLLTLALPFTLPWLLWDFMMARRWSRVSLAWTVRSWLDHIADAWTAFLHWGDAPVRTSTTTTTKETLMEAPAQPWRLRKQVKT